MYCLNMMAIGWNCEGRSGVRRCSQQIFEHFVHIAHAMNDMGPGAGRYGTKKTDFIMTCCIFERRRTLSEDSVDGRIDSLFAVETLEPEIVSGCRIQAAHAVVHRQSSGHAETH